MTYAAYAHRGAYPLIVTALLAAAFVIMAMRPGSDAERSPLIRDLVFLWTGTERAAGDLVDPAPRPLRGVLFAHLLARGSLRLDAAGRRRTAADRGADRSRPFQFVAGDDDDFGSLALALYICCFINFPQLIANYNVEHSRQLSGTGTTIDTAYLVSLGPQAIPAIDRFFLPRREFYTWSQELKQRATRSQRATTTGCGTGAGWTYRNWKLMQYLQREGIVRP